MDMLAVVAAAALIQNPPESRFELVSPYPSLPWVRIHESLAKVGIAQSTARRENLQGRVLWIDATANIDRVNSDDKVAALMTKIADVGFNTIVYDVKPIVGYTMYPSKLNDQLLWWRDQNMPAGYDPLAAVIREGKRNGLSVLVAMNAFSEGHSYSVRDQDVQPRNPFFKPGWGHSRPDLQSVKYVALPVWKGKDVAPTVNPTSWATPFAVYNRLPTAEIEASALLDAFGRVISVHVGKPEAFAGVSLLAARGEGVNQLLGLRPGQRVFFDSRAEFKPSGEDQNQIPLMMNPHNAEVQQRTFDFIEEVAQYDVDGLLFDDRLRFGGLDSDFSEETRLLFEVKVGQQLKWPEDVYVVTYGTDLKAGIKPGRFYDAWLTFRADTMKAWVADARAHFKKFNDGIFGIYAGSWYGDYPRYGTNYASSDLDAGFPFLTRGYRGSGLAEHLDVLMTGAYYGQGTVYQAIQEGGVPGRTVEAAGILSNRVARDQTWTYAGIMLDTFRTKPDRVTEAIQAAAATTQGIMVFDLSHGIEEFWPYFERAFKTPAVAPHTTDLLTQVRKRRAEADARGDRLPPFPMFEGAPGTGF